MDVLVASSKPRGAGAPEPEVAAEFKSVDRHLAGELKSRSTLGDGLFEGVSAGGYAYRVREIREGFRSGISDGGRTQWSPIGLIKSEATIKKGKSTGVYSEWREAMNAP